jgi:hypothetical protein
MPGQFIDYEPMPQPGAYQFTRADGSPFVATGPDADALAKQIEREKQARREQMLAFNGAGGREDAGRGMSVPDAPPSMMSQVGPTREAAQGPRPGAPPQGPPPPGPPGQPPRSPHGQVQDYLFRPEYSPGRPGVSREQLQQRSKQGVAMPRGGEQVVEGGYPVNEDYMDAMGEFSVERRRQADAGAQLALSEARQGQADAIADHSRNAARQQEQQKVTNDLMKRVRDDRARYEEVRAEYQKAEVDPKRVFSGVGGVLAAIASAIAQGLGAYAATLGKTENFAAGIIDSMIERDIAAQEKELATKGWAADNALSDMLRETENLDQAKALLRTVQLDYVSSQRAQVAAASKSQQIQQRAQEWDLAEQEKFTRWQEEYMRNSMGKHSARISQDMQYPVAPQGGGYRPPSERTIQQRAKTLSDVQGLEKGEVDISKGRADTAKTEAEAAREAAMGGATEKDAFTYKQNKVAVDSGQKALESYGGQIGATFDPRTRTWKGDVGGVWSTAPVVGSERSKRIKADANTLAPMIARGLEGGSAPNADNIRDLQENLTSMSGESMLSMLNALQRRMDEQQSALDTSVPGTVVQGSQSRAAEAQREDTSRRTGFAPPPAAGAPLPAPRPLR